MIFLQLPVDAISEPLGDRTEVGIRDELGELYRRHLGIALTAFVPNFQASRRFRSSR